MENLSNLLNQYNIECSKDTYENFYIDCVEDNIILKCSSAQDLFEELRILLYFKHQEFDNITADKIKNDITSPNLMIAVIEAMRAGICSINVSKTQGFVMCQFGDNEFYFNECASNSCSFDEFLTSVSKIYPNYSYLNVAKDIAKTIIDMRSYDPTESLYYLYLMKEELPPFYDDILGHYIEVAEKAEQEPENLSL